MPFLNNDPNEGRYRSNCTYCQNWGIVLDEEGNMYVCHRCNGSCEGFSQAITKYYLGFRGFTVRINENK
jgi:hypothetical protein